LSTGDTGYAPSTASARGRDSPLTAVLEEEVAAFLGRARYERGGRFRGYRNEYEASRELTVGMGAVAVRVAQVPEEVDPEGYQSQLVPKYQRASASTQRLFTRLYLEGLATGDCEPVFRELVGGTTALAPTAIVRIKEQWAEDYALWRQRPLGDHCYAYVWADGVYLGIGDEVERMAVLVVLGALKDGGKELLALDLGYRRSCSCPADSHPQPDLVCHPCSCITKR
jgi:putative transposase